MSARPASYDREERHRIGNFVAEFSVAAREGPLSAPERLAQQIRSELLPALETVFDDPTLEDHDASVEVLDIDLGQWPADPDWPSVREEFRLRLLAALAPHLRLRGDDPVSRSDRDADVIAAGHPAGQGRQAHTSFGERGPDHDHGIIPFDRDVPDEGLTTSGEAFRTISGQPGTDVYTLLRAASHRGVETFEAALAALPDAAHRRFLRESLDGVHEISAPTVDRVKSALVGLLQQAGQRPATAAQMATTLVARLLLHPVGAHLVSSEVTQSVGWSDGGAGVATGRQVLPDSHSLSRGDWSSRDTPQHSDTRQASKAGLSFDGSRKLENPAHLRSAWADNRTATVAVLQDHDTEGLFQLLGSLLPRAGAEFLLSIEHRYATAAHPKALLLSVISAVLDNRPIDLDAGTDQGPTADAALGTEHTQDIVHEVDPSAPKQIDPMHEPPSWQTVLSLLSSDHGDALPADTQDGPGTDQHDAADIASEEADAPVKAAVFKHRGVAETGALADVTRADVAHRSEAAPTDPPEVRGEQGAPLHSRVDGLAEGKGSAPDASEQSHDRTKLQDDEFSAAQPDQEPTTASPVPEVEGSAAELSEDAGRDTGSQIVFRHGASDVTERGTASLHADPESGRGPRRGIAPISSALSPERAADSDRASHSVTQGDVERRRASPHSAAHEGDKEPGAADSDAGTQGAEPVQHSGENERGAGAAPGRSSQVQRPSDAQPDDFEVTQNTPQPGRAAESGEQSIEPQESGFARDRGTAAIPADNLSSEDPESTVSDQTRTADTDRDRRMQAAGDAADASGLSPNHPAVQALVDVTFGSAAAEIDEALALVWSALPDPGKRHALAQISRVGQRDVRDFETPEYQPASAGLRLALVARIGPAADATELAVILSHVLDIASKDEDDRRRLIRHLTARLSYPTDIASPVLRLKVLRALDAPARTGTGGRSDDRAEEAKPAEASRDVRLLTRNAGLVLFHPFCKLLFSRLELLTSDDLLAPDQLGRGRAVLTALSGEADPTLPFDAVMRVLLGLNAAVPPPPQMRLEDPEYEMIDGLIRSVIAEWSKLGQTSPAGLQEAFVRRGGQLRFDATGAHLTVDPGPFDVLLDSLPWSVDTMIALPWMPVPCHVVWRSQDG